MTKRRRWIAVAGLASVAASLPARGDDVVPITGRADATYAPFDRLMSRFVREQRVPGASFAAARGGRVVYARGFGYTSDDRLRAVEPTSLFRVASLSKPITALAVLTYVDSGAIALDDPVAALLTAEFERDPPVDPRLRSITIRQLLQHTGGWDSSRTFDPMFRTVAIAEEFRATPPAGPDLILRSMLRRPLDFDPGARYAYSNFGYSVLGRVLERLSMRSYAACVRDRVLSPLGIVDMSIGRTLPRDRDPREVGYRNVRDLREPAVLGPDFGKPTPLPDGAWSHEALDAHGGWIATASDLALIATQLDRGQSKLLTERSRRAIVERPPGPAGHNDDGTPRDVYYGLGWRVRDLGGDRRALWHTGSLPGTSALLVHRDDDTSWAVLFNARDNPDGKPLAVLIDPLVHRAAGEIRAWTASP